MEAFQNRSHSEQLLGSWSKQDSFQLGIGVDARVNSIERYTFRSDGTGLHSYKDDSGLPTNDTDREFVFVTDDNQIVFCSDDLPDESAIEFKTDGNKLILDFGGSEEVYIRVIAE